MEKENFFGGGHPHLNWMQPAEAAAMSEMDSALADHLQQPGAGGGGFFNINWDQSMDQSSRFESTLNSIVSSPSNPAPPASAADSVVIRELIGRLGSICNSGEISPHLLGGGSSSANTSCYSTPLNSPPKLNLSSMLEYQQQQQQSAGLPISGTLVPPPVAAHMVPFATDPGFTERAARFTSFAGRNFGGFQPQFPLPDTGKLSRNSSSKTLRVGSGPQVAGAENPMLSRSSTPEDGREESSVSGHESTVRGGAGESNARKRKATQRGKANSAAKDLPKVAEEEDANGKRTRSSEAGKDAIKPKEEHSSGNSDGGGQKQGKENNSKPAEPPKQDYIHVRARRGQATDSHSLAERVRREKISERMKFLQDLVPGCNKVTGKAVMLDEIINYVQSLQRQVEFLSMKLATVNPRLDFNVEGLLQKEIHQPRGSLPHPMFPVESPAPPQAFPFAQQLIQSPALHALVTNGMENHCPVNPLDATLRSSLGMLLPAFDGGDAASQVGTFWEDDLQSFVQMGFGQNQEVPFSSQPFHGQSQTTHMKVEI